VGERAHRTSARILMAFAVALFIVPTGEGETDAVTLALVGGTIYTSPSDEPIRDGVILIGDATVVRVGRRTSVRVPKQARVIDCGGLTITAGFWNSHVHFLQRKWADAATLPAPELARQLEVMLTRYGFTTVFDTWSMWENTRRLRERIESSEVSGPHIFSTGETLFPPVARPPSTGGWNALGFIPLERFRIASVSEATEGRDAARRLLDAGVDGIKVYAKTLDPDGPAMPEAAIRAVVAESHAHEKPVFAHPTTVSGLLAAVRAGVDVLTHTTPLSGPWEPSTITEMTQARVALTPTIALWRYEGRHDRASLGDNATSTAVGQLRAFVAAGGRVLFGTDVGYMSSYDPADEYALMAESGMTPRQILASLTTAPAERFERTRAGGRITPGGAADLTILVTDPMTDVRGFTSVRYTIRRGRILYGR